MSAADVMGLSCVCMGAGTVLAMVGTGTASNRDRFGWLMLTVTQGVGFMLSLLILAMLVER